MMESNKINKESILYGTLVILAVSVASKLASFIVEAVLAAYLGTSSVGDAYYMISGIQQVLYPMLSVGIWKVFLPEYKKTLTSKGTLDADALANKTIFVFTILSVVFSILLALCAGPITSLIAPGFDENTAMLCSQLVCITSPMYIFIIISSVYATMLQCHNKFFGSQIREIATHLPLILCAVFLYDKLGVWSLALGLLLGSLVRLLIEIPFLSWGYHFKIDTKIRTKQMRSMVGQMPSALVASGADQVTIFVNKMIASMQATGTVSALNYASKLQNVFIGLFSSAVLTASYPKIAEYALEDNKVALASLLERIICTTIVFLAPIAFFAVLLGKDFVSVLFERGAFDHVSTTLTSAAFICYSFGLIFAAVFTLFNNVFYSYGKAKDAMGAGLVCMLSNVILCFVLSGPFGAAGLALASSISYFLAFSWQARNLRDIVSLSKAVILKEFGKSLLSASLASVIFLFLLPFIDSSIVRVLAGFLCFSFLYLSLIMLTRTETSALIKKRFGGKLFRR